MIVYLDTPSLLCATTVVYYLPSGCIEKCYRDSDWNIEKLRDQKCRDAARKLREAGLEGSEEGLKGRNERKK